MQGFQWLMRFKCFLLASALAILGNPPATIRQCAFPDNYYR